MTRHVYLDTAVAALASGNDSPERAVCRRVLEKAAAGDLVLHASTETVQEFCFHRMRMTDRKRAIAEAEHLMALAVVHDFDHETLVESLRLTATTPIRGRDAVHAATALLHGVTEIVSPDRAFDDAPGLTRIDPTNL